MNSYTKNKKAKRHGFLKFMIFVVCALCMFVAAKKILDSGVLDRFTGSPSISNPGTDFLPPQRPGAENDLQAMVESLSREDSRVKDVLSNMDAYPETLLELLVKNPDARDYVLNYPSRKDDQTVGSIYPSELDNGIPRLYQWDDRWGYYEYGSGPIGITGCGPTCLSMVIMGLTGNTDATPAAIADLSIASGYYVSGEGSTWDLMHSGASSYGLTSTVLGLDEEGMKQAISQGKPIIINVGFGDFTNTGHFLVITDYVDGMFILNDPNSKTLSSEAWLYSTLAPQIRNIWAFSVT